MAVSLIRLLVRAARASQRDPDAPPLPAGQVIGIIAGTAVLLNVAFYFLSNVYFQDRTAVYGAVTPEHVNDVRITFAIFTGVVGAGAIGAVFRPLWVGLGIAALTAIAALIAGVSAAAHDMTPVLPASLIVSGLVLAVLVWKALEQKRGAWAFLIGMTSVLSAVLLFGATKVRNVLDVGLWTALIIPGLLAVATAALSNIRDDYRDA